MKYLSFKNGDQMPIFGLGTWKSEPGQVYAAVKEAITIGYRHLDCAFIYGNEHEIGEGIKACIDDGIVSRDELWVTSKLWNDAHEPEDVAPAIKKTLEDLKLAYLDLYLIHWPVATKKGKLLPEHGEDFISPQDLSSVQTWEAMEKLVHDRLVKHIGVSNYNIPKLQELIDRAAIKPEVNQVELHPYLQQNELVLFCKDHGIHLTAYSPLGSMDRPENLKGENEPILLEDPTITSIADKYNVSPAQVLISWAIHRDTSVIPKSVNLSRLKQNLAAVELELSTQDMEVIAGLDKKRRYVDGSFWAIEGSPHTVSSLWNE